MNTPFFVAWRYLRGQRSTRLAQWVTRAAALGLAVGTAAMVVVLSAFDGLENTIVDSYTPAYPSVLLERFDGKPLTLTEAEDAVHSAPSGLQGFPVIERHVLLRNGRFEGVALVKGVDWEYLNVSRWFDSIRADIPHLPWPTQATDPIPMLLGSGVAAQLGLTQQREASLIECWIPKKDAHSPDEWSLSSLDPSAALERANGLPVAVFSIHPEVDLDKVVIPIGHAAVYFESEKNRHRVEFFSTTDIHTVPSDTLKEWRIQAAQKGWNLLTLEEQQASLFRVLRLEKLATYGILTFVVLLASFGLYGAIVLLIIEKRVDNNTLRSLGTSAGQLQRVYAYSGAFIALAGIGMGLLLGASLTWGQATFGWVKLGSGYLLDAYPMDLRWTSLALAAVTVLVCGSAMSFAAARFSRQDLRKQ